MHAQSVCLSYQINKIIHNVTDVESNKDLWIKKDTRVSYPLNIAIKQSFCYGSRDEYTICLNENHEKAKPIKEILQEVHGNQK